MEILQVTDYDVLADKMPGQRYILEDYRRHIGNTRFSVLVDMYREAYDMVLMRGNDAECDKIVERIVGVACHKDVAITVNKGRFLIRTNGEGDWVCLDETESKQVVRQALTAPTTILEEEEEPVTGEVAASTAFSAMHLGVRGMPDVPLPPPVSENPEFNNDKKRGRRRSLLRRSASESTMMDDKKKLQIRGLGLDTMASVAVLDGDDEFDASTDSGLDAQAWLQDRLPERPRAPAGMLARQLSAPVMSAPVVSHSTERIKEWKGMDVVLSASGRTLTTKETVVGNNRLQVMVTIQKDKYSTLSPEEQDKVADDLVKAVCQYWGGRILIDQGFTYAKLGDEQASLAMKNLLNPEEAQAIMVSTSAPSKPLLSAPPVPDFLRNASLEILQNGVPAGKPASMQKNAIQSLQERKAKRTMTKSLGRLDAHEID
jgi:hypothetical protein